ncbi:metallophosphoesterase [uncultured Cardiobacterium sp.]|uniref:metallophosphoesterase n=1 Tax=uncultured Cardiobacterium sp. TaxID=417619 RepID=UPI002606A823|nr:metallophosphoesterase [uncultured Cardiobacterium sp.]
MPRWFFVVLVFGVMQLLLWVFARSLRFLLRDRPRRLTLAVFLCGDGLLLAAMTRLVPALFIVHAWVMALLWLWFMVAVAAYPLYRLIKVFHPQRAALFFRAFLPTGFVALFAWGFFNANATVVRHYQITLPKAMVPLRVGVAADIHLGSHFFYGARELDRLAALMTQEEVDIILLPGDVINDNTAAFRAENMQAHLQALRAPLGVYATLGNHEFYGDVTENAQALRDSGVHLLRDETVVVADRLVLAGRDDDMHEDRPPLAALLDGVRRDLPIIVLDHRPGDIAANVQTAMDMQVSGHTHNGQIFPANFIADAVYRLAYGHEKIAGKDVFVSSGYGFWGVPLRLGSRSEILVIDLRGTDD